MKHIKHQIKLRLQQIRKNCVSSSTKSINIHYIHTKKKFFRLKGKQIGRRCNAWYWFVPFIRDDYFCWSSIVTCLPILPVQRTCMPSGKRALVKGCGNANSYAVVTWLSLSTCVLLWPSHECRLLVGAPCMTLCGEGKYSTGGLPW